MITVGDLLKELERENPVIPIVFKLNEEASFYPEEILVGNRSSQYIAPPIAPERGDMNMVIKYLLPVLKKRYGYHITKEHKKWLNKEIVPYWDDKCVRAMKVKLFDEANLSSKITLGGGGLKRLRQAFGLKHIGKLVADPANNTFDKITITCVIYFQ